MLITSTLLVVGLIAAAPSAAFQGPWITPPVVLSPPPQGIATAPQLAIGPDGTTTVVWARSGGSSWAVGASTRSPGGTFAPPEDLSGDGPDANIPQVAVGQDGTTTVVWSRTSGATFVVQARTRPAGGAFGPTVNVSPSGRQDFVMGVATAADGATTVIWEEADGQNWTVYASTRPAGAAFGAPVQLSATADHDAEPVPRLATGGDGTTTVVWNQYRGGSWVVQASTRPAGGSFGPAVDLSAPSTLAPNPRVAASSDGATTVVWALSEDRIQASTRVLGGTFSAPTDVSIATQGARRPQIAVSGGGEATVVWEHPHSGGWSIQAGTRPAGGPFAAPVDVSAADDDARAPLVVGAPDGTTDLLWERLGTTGGVVQASTRAIGGAFSSPHDLSAPASTSQLARAAVAPDGAATVVFAGDGVVRTVITANPPALRSAPVITGDVALGAPLGCDGGTWIGAASVTPEWLRAGTRVATGPAYSIGGDDRGTALSCRSRASNPFGTVEALSLPLLVPAPPARTLPPSARSLPKIIGAARIGRRLRCTAARFIGATSRATDWLRGRKPIKGARGSTYRITRKDIGKIIACRTTAKGAGGTSTSISLGIRARR